MRVCMCVCVPNVWWRFSLVAFWHTNTNIASSGDESSFQLVTNFTLWVSLLLAVASNCILRFYCNTPLGVLNYWMRVKEISLHMIQAWYCMRLLVQVALQLNMNGKYIVRWAMSMVMVFHTPHILHTNRYYAAANSMSIGHNSSGRAVNDIILCQKCMVGTNLDTWPLMNFLNWINLFHAIMWQVIRWPGLQ